MKSIRLAIVLGVSTLLFAACESNLTDTTTPESEGLQVVTGKHSKVAGDLNSEGSYLLSFKGNKLPKNFASEVEAAGGTVVYQHESGFAYVQGLSDDAAEKFRTRKDISNFAADASFTLDLPDEPTTFEASVASPANPAGAFFFARQWHHRAIGADQAWAAGYLGSEDVTVAILDTGIDYENLDLAGRVDLSRSVSFRPDEDALVSTNFPAKHPITDLQYHGTHVAATVVSNGFVGAGVTSGTTLMGVKVCGVDRSCSFGAIISGLLYAADNGADIINMSLGGAFLKPGNGQFVGFINQVMNSVSSQGVTVVVAAGNSAANLDQDGYIYDTYCDAPNTICVSATGPAAAETINGPYTDIDAFASYSNFGRSAIDVAAPGGNAVAVYAACSQTSIVIPVCQTGSFILGISGTSMAAPHVSGLAALLVSQGVDKPSQIKAAIQQSADDLGQPGTDPYYGKGRINVAKALGL